MDASKKGTWLPGLAVFIFLAVVFVSIGLVSKWLGVGAGCASATPTGTAVNASPFVRYTGSTAGKDAKPFAIEVSDDGLTALIGLCYQESKSYLPDLLHLHSLVTQLASAQPLSSYSAGVAQAQQTLTFTEAGATKTVVFDDSATASPVPAQLLDVVAVLRQFVNLAPLATQAANTTRVTLSYQSVSLAPTYVIGIDTGGAVTLYADGRYEGASQLSPTQITDLDNLIEKASFFELASSYSLGPRWPLGEGSNSDVRITKGGRTKFVAVEGASGPDGLDQLVTWLYKLASGY